VRLGIARHLFRRAGGDDLAALIAAFRAEIDEPVRGLDDVEIVFNDQERGARFQELAESGQQLAISSKWRPVVGSSRM